MNETILNSKDLTLEEMSRINAGGAPTQSIADFFAWVACGGHDYVRTGREQERSFFAFWTKHQREYRCRKCGHRTWKDED